MDAHLHNAQKVADFLAAHPAVKKVIYPGLASHPGHDALGAFASGFGGMVSIELEGALRTAPPCSTTCSCLCRR